MLAMAYKYMYSDIYVYMETMPQSRFTKIPRRSLSKSCSLNFSARTKNMNRDP